MKPSDTPSPALSERQRAIMTLAAEGVPQRLIARRLGISPRTVEVHARRLRKLLGATTMAQAIVIAVRQELFSVEKGKGYG